MSKKVLSAQVNSTMAALYSPSDSLNAKIRALHAAGYERADIARHLDVIYQRVRNCLVTPVAKPTMATKQIREMVEGDL